MFHGCPMLQVGTTGIEEEEDKNSIILIPYYI
jgi:hypothetical protein